MFGFLNHTFLLALAAVAAPLLIHLFARQRRKRLLFSQVQLLQTLQIRRVRRIQLLQHLLLLIRCLAVLFIVLAFARPALRSTRFSPGQSGAAQVCILDRSLSMDRSSAFQQAKQRAIEWSKLLKPPDKGTLLWLDQSQTQEVKWNYSAGPLDRILQSTSVLSERGEFSRRMPEIRALLGKSNELNRELYLFSDLQKSGFVQSVDSAATMAEPVSIFVIPVRADTDNAGIITGGVASQILYPAIPFRVFAEVRNYGSQDLEALSIRVLINGKASAGQTIRLPARAGKRVEFRIRPDGTGPFLGEIVIDDDILTWDDHYYFSGKIPDRIHIALIGETIEDTAPVDLALTVMRDDEGVFRPTSFQKGQDWISALSSRDVVVFSNYPDFSPAEAEAIASFLRAGKGVVILPGPRMNAVNYQNRLLGPVLDLNIHQAITDKESGGWTLGRPDWNHPLFEDLFETAEPEVKSPRVYNRLEISGKDFTTVLAFRDGTPFLVEKQLERGKVLIFGTGTDPDWSDLKYTTLFAPLMFRAGLALAENSEGLSRTCYSGEALRVTRSAERLAERYAVIDPEENRILLNPEIRAGDLQLTLDRTSVPGFYRFFEEDRQFAVRAVNVHPSESDLEPMSPDSLRSFFPNAKIHVISPEDGPLAQIVSQLRWGRELWWEILMIALLLLVAEIVIARIAMHKARTG